MAVYTKCSEYCLYRLIKSTYQLPLDNMSTWKNEFIAHFDGVRVLVLKAPIYFKPALQQNLQLPCINC